MQFVCDSLQCDVVLCNIGSHGQTKVVPRDQIQSNSNCQKQGSPSTEWYNLQCVKHSFFSPKKLVKQGLSNYNPLRPHTTKDRENVKMAHVAAHPTCTRAGSPCRETTNISCVSAIIKLCVAQ